MELEGKLLLAYILVCLHCTEAGQLDRLEKDVLPLNPMEKSFAIKLGRKEQKVARRQLAYPGIQ
ncbi:hypothetical protein BV22DRAFT_1042092, partial [Leucogyrophana mollusca]